MTHNIARIIVSKKKINESSVMMECTVTVMCLYGQLILTRGGNITTCRPSVNDGRAGGARVMVRLRKPINCVLQLLI